MTLVSFGTESDSTQMAHLEALLGLGYGLGYGSGLPTARRPGRRRAPGSRPCRSPFRSPPAAAPDTGFELPLRREPESSFLNNIQLRLNIISNLC
jgi:hypothetical protein